MNTIKFIKSNPPETAIPSTTGYVGLFGLIFYLIFCIYFKPTPTSGIIFVILATGLPMWLVEFFRFPSIDRSVSTPLILRLRWRLWGFFAAFVVWAAILALFHVAGHGAVLYFWEAAFAAWPFIFLFIILFFIKPESLSPYTLDTLGRAFTEKKSWHLIPWSILRGHAIKAFFLPLMVDFSYLWFYKIDATFNLSNDFAWFLIPMAVLYLIDTTFAVIGYLSTFDRLDAHIRSTDATWSGWCSALICYPPFFTWATILGITKYRDGYEWHHWLEASSIFYYSWGVAILLLTMIYVWATIVFGIRFSNLTNRGIITNGPFRYTKHPAYISKNISWWLISIPFISSLGTNYAVINCLILLLVNGIYWMRAKTEERHLSNDSTYRAYSAWIAENGIFSKIRRNINIIK